MTTMIRNTIKRVKPLWLLIMLCVFLNAFAGEDKLNAIMNTVSQKLDLLSVKNHVEIGLSAIDTYNHTEINYHADLRFPMDSTAKLMVVAALLKKSESDPNLLQKKIFFTKSEIKKSTYSPIISKSGQDGLTVSQLCAAALEYSDNAATNQLIKILGGPNKVTAFARSIGDKQFLLVRCEPALNSAIPEDIRDTTTPMAMADSLQKLLLGNVLGNTKRQQLQDWMKGCHTGQDRIRAGVPHNFIVANKTGSGDYGAIGDIAVIWRTHGSPIVLVVYVRQNEKNAHTPGKIIAQATKIVINAMANLH